MFQSVDQKQSFPQLEHEVLEFWEKNRIFEKSVKAREGGKKFVFFDGPPFANGLPHYGHILAGSMKDAITRYATMRGYYVPRVNGWDCHGLPVEYEIEKKLGLSGRKDIEKMGIAEFNTQCRESVFTYTQEWETLMKRVGRWVDFENSYATLNNDYMESIWWVFQQIWLKKMVYSGYKSMHVCPRCETPLSNFEVSQGYKDVTDLSVYAKFKLVDEDVFVLAWTTTPWTLPANVGLCMGPKIAYVKVGVKYEDGKEEIYIAARELVEKVFDGLNYNILEDIDPKKMEGKKYEPLFDFYKDSSVGPEDGGQKFVITLDDYVTTTEGTGVVHLAPMFGEDDYRVAQKYKLAMIQHVHMDGTFKAEVKPWAGKFVKGQDQNIVAALEEKGLCFKSLNVRHSYPHCWRCDTPLLNYSTRSWFIKVTEIKERLLKNNKKVGWRPEHIQEGRFGKWLEGARDWAVSRNRFWGCPIPVWECVGSGGEGNAAGCGAFLCVGSIEEMKERSGGKLPLRDGELDLHKPYIDDITFECTECGKLMRRIPEVLDCWFESGSMPYAQLHYPFENKKEFEENFPANFIAEGLDQTRGWFYTLHVLASILFDKPAFQNVIVNGTILAADGEKLSKRKKNYPDPAALFESKGVDAMRMFLLSSPVTLAEDIRFSEQHVDEMVKKFSLTLWNTYSFFVTYANIDGWSPADGKRGPAEGKKGKGKSGDFLPSHKLDQWILSELNQLMVTATEAMDDYNFPRATRPIIEFVDGLSNWYIRRSRRRFWKSENDGDKMEAYQTLYTVLVELSRLLAPFMPFLADAIYRNLVGGAGAGEQAHSALGASRVDSVHLADWPVANKKLIQPELNREIQTVRSIVTLGHSVRDAANRKVRQPLALVQVALPAHIDADTVKAQEVVILEELNVKQLQILQDAADFVKVVVKPNARALGPKYGKAVQDIIRMAKAGEFEVLKGAGGVKVGEYVLTGDEVEVGFEGREGFDVASADGISVVLDTVVTDELKQEGYAREIVRALQDLRKEADYNVDDRITIFVGVEKQTSDASAVESGLSADILEAAVTQFANYIQRETLANELVNKGDFAWDKERVVDVDGVSVKVAVRR